MPRIKELIHGECGCRLDGRVYLYVGKAVKLRNRMMSYSEWSARVSPKPPSWINRFIDPPHSHLISAAVWYEERRVISSAEETLISVLKPLFNQQSVDGFGGNWIVRNPDLIVDLQDMAPKLKRDDVDVWVESHAGVYAWFIDPGAFMGHGHGLELLDGILDPGGNDMEQREKAIRQSAAVKKAYSKRVLNRVFGEEIEALDGMFR